MLEITFVLNKIKKGLEDRNLAEVARKTGLSYPTVYNFAKGDLTIAKVSTAITLAKYLKFMDSNV